MNKIKIVGALVFIIALILALISVDIANKNRLNIDALTIFSKQKESIQEVSKSVFYSYRNGLSGSLNIKELESSGVALVLFGGEDSDYKNITIKIQTLWKNFYADVKKFKIQQRVTTGYNSIITAKLVNRIYHTNVLLINHFNQIIELRKSEANEQIERYKKLQNILFFILIGLLFYLFTQLHFVIEFIHKFSKTSKNIIKNSTIKGVESIDVKATTHELNEATNSYNYMVQKMNNSIIASGQSMDNSIKSLEEVAENIENFMELLAVMNPKESDEFFKKEDAVIDALDTLMRLRRRLKDLKIELDNLAHS